MKMKEQAFIDGLRKLNKKYIDGLPEKEKARFGGYKEIDPLRVVKVILSDFIVDIGRRALGGGLLNRKI